MARKAKIVIDQNLIPPGANEVDFPIRLVAANLPPEMLVSGGVNAAKPDGGDIRFFADEALSQQLSADVCVFKQAAQPTNAAAIIYVRLPQIVSTSVNEFWVYYSDPNLSLIPPGDPYGAMEVWSNGYEVAFVAPMSLESDDALINHVNWAAGYAVSGRNRSILLTHESANSNIPNVHQGLTTDGQFWWAIHTNYIEKYATLDGTSLASNTSPFSGVDTACDHLGAGEVYGQYLYVPAEHYASCSDYSNQYIAWYDKDTLAFVGKFDVSAQGHEVAALTIDGTAGVIYVVSYCDGSKIFKYDLSTGSYLGNIAISPAITNGSPQGITKCGEYFLISVSGPGYLYRVRNDGVRFGGVTKDYTDAGNESVCYDGEYVYWLDGISPSVLHKYKSIEFSETTYFGGPYAAQGITHTLPNSGSIYVYVKPNRFFNYNSIFDTSGDANDWEAWIYSDGRYKARIDVATNTFTLADASAVHQLGFEWDTATNVNLVVNGAKLSAESDNWVAPASEFYINGGNAGNTTGEGDYLAVLVSNVSRSVDWAVLENNSIGSTSTFTSSLAPVDHVTNVRALAFDNTLVREPGLLAPRRQPVCRTAINVSHPIARDLKICILPAEMYYGESDLVGAVEFDGALLSGVLLDVSGNGRYLHTPNSNAVYRGWTFTTPQFATGVTVAARVRRTVSNGYSIIKSSTAAAIFALRSTDIGGIELRLAEGSWVQTLRGSAVDGSVQSGDWYDAAMSWAAGSNVIDAVINGRDQPVTYSYTGSPNSVPPYDVELLGNTSNWMVADIGLEYLYIWDRHLDRAEIVDVQRDPYQFLIPAG